MCVGGGGGGGIYGSAWHDGLVQQLHGLKEQWMHVQEGVLFHTVQV